MNSNRGGTYGYRLSSSACWGALHDASAWLGPSFLAPQTGAVCKTVGFSKGYSEDPDVAILPDLAVYENQGGALRVPRGCRPAAVVRGSVVQRGAARKHGRSGQITAAGAGNTNNRLAAIHLLFRYATLRVARGFLLQPVPESVAGGQHRPGPSRCPPTRADRAVGKGTGGSGGRRRPALHGTDPRHAILRIDDFPLSLRAVHSPEQAGMQLSRSKNSSGSITAALCPLAKARHATLPAQSFRLSAYAWTNDCQDLR